MQKKMLELSGWIGMLLIHGATLPTTLGLLMGTNPKTPEASMVLLIWAGLFCYFIRAVSVKDTLHIVSNGVGFFLQSSLLALIVFGA